MLSLVSNYEYCQFLLNQQTNALEALSLANRHVSGQSAVGGRLETHLAIDNELV